MGVVKEILRAGFGLAVARGHAVTVHAIAFGKNGDLSQEIWRRVIKFQLLKFSWQAPVTFKADQETVLKGLSEGVIGMRQRELARLECSPDYGYPKGHRSYGVLPKSKLVFEVDVLKIENVNEYRY